MLLVHLRRGGSGYAALTAKTTSASSIASSSSTAASSTASAASTTFSTLSASSTAATAPATFSTSTTFSTSSLTPTPFVILFESGSGSSWLAATLAAHPRACLVLFEPIDNSSLTSAADHASRLQWLELLWSPPPVTSPPAQWANWRRRLVAASRFGQVPLIRDSLERCAADSRAFGLKARLSRLLTHAQAVTGLRELLARKRVRVLRLERKNRIKQALAEYRRLYAGLGHFKASAVAASASSSSSAAASSSSAAAASAKVATTAVRVDLKRFRQSVAAVERSHRLASKVLAQLEPSQPLLALGYEQLLSGQAEVMRRVEAFLGLADASSGGAGAAGASGAGAAASGAGAAASAPPPAAVYRKATPDRLCAAVLNYAALCREWWHGRYAEYFDEPCEAACGAGSTSHATEPR